MCQPAVPLRRPSLGKAACGKAEGSGGKTGPNLGAYSVGVSAARTLGWMSGTYPLEGGHNTMTVVLALIAVFVPASVTLVGYWFRQQSEKRLAQEQKQSKDRLAEEHEQSESRLDQQQKQEYDRLRLDAAIRAADLFTHASGDAVANAARCASGLLVLTRLGFR